MMAGSVSNPLLNAFFAKASNTQIPTSQQCYIGFSTTTPTANGDNVGNFTEPAASTGYERCLVGIVNNVPMQLMDSAAGGVIKNGSHRIYAFRAKSEIGPFTHMGLFSAKTGGTPILSEPLTTPVTCAAGAVMLFDPSGLKISLT